MIQKIIFISALLFVKPVIAQQIIKGQVFEIVDSKEMSLPGATLLWVNSQQAVSSDKEGKFSLEISDQLPGKIVVSSVGFKTDTLEIATSDFIKVLLKKSINLKEVNVTAKKEDITISTINPINSETITENELLKAACCNISEAFETNPSVNVDYKDAVTGVKEIQLLGLGGIYVQMLNENIPDMHGLAGIYGLTFIPGPWIESIQLTKGSGSVLNGYESATGQINVELKKPNNKEIPRLFFNLFGEESGALEGNIILKQKVNSKLSTMLMLHGRRMKSEMDRNSDGFMDTPDNRSFNIYNRWQYHSSKKLEGQLSIKFLSDDINGGQTDKVSNFPIYKTYVNTKRAEVSGKVGLIYPENPAKSIGNIYQFTLHDMKSSFGLKKYNARESSIYLESIYQNVLGGLNHEYKMGLTFRYNRLEEEFPGLPKLVEENIPGVFLEYTYKYFDKMTIVAGLREDLQANKEWIFTPRIHGKYNFTEDFIFRASAGRSYRKPYLIADHLSVLASSREIIFSEKINPERAWNYGVNFTKRGMIAGHEFSLSADAYRTNFTEQLVVDAYSDSTRIQFYNLKGKSYSNSFQFTINSEILEGLDLRLAYKIDDVKSTFNGKLEEQPLISRERALFTLSYKTSNEHWKFDFTTVWEGKKRLQNTFSSLESNSNKYSPDYATSNLQITKVFRKFELYGGSENLFDYRQLDPIIHPENPFGNSFDATNIWGPIQGRRVYAGLRMSIR